MKTVLEYKITTFLTLFILRPSLVKKKLFKTDSVIFFLYILEDASSSSLMRLMGSLKRISLIIDKEMVSVISNIYLQIFNTNNRLNIYKGLHPTLALPQAVYELLFLQSL